MCHTAMKENIQTPYTLIQVNFAQRIQQANLCSLILNIEGAIDHSWLQNQSECEHTKYLFTLHHCNFLIFSIVIIQSDSSQLHYPPVILTTRILIISSLTMVCWFHS